VKLIRLTDDRYVLDAGPDIVPYQLDAIRAYWQDWWRTESDIPQVVVFGGLTIPLEYEDRRDADIVGRFDRLEERVEAILAETQRLYDFVGDVDPSIIDAWHFGENVRKQREAAGD